MRIRHGPARGMKWITGSSIHGCWLGTYELAKQIALQRFVKPGMVVYDIGAQAGFYTLFFSRLVGEAGRVYAFEPCPYEAHFLVNHVRINELANVRIVQAAVGERTGLVGMTIDRGMTQNQICNRSESVLAVPAVTLDRSGLEPPDLIKMDVEGAESLVLKGARDTLCNARPVVFIALHGPEQRAECVGILRSSGYGIYSLKGQPLDKASPTDEIYGLLTQPTVGKVARSEGPIEI